MNQNATISKQIKPKKIKLVADYLALRKKLNLTQFEFWSRLGITQSGGSRYENGRPTPKSVAILARLIFIDGLEIDARRFSS